MEKRTNGVAWRLAVVLAALLLIASALVLAWSVNKPWLPAGLDLRLREVWLPHAFLSLVASVYMLANLWEASRGGFRWYAEGLVSAVILFILWLIVWPVTCLPSPPAAHANFQGRNLRGAHLSSYNFSSANLGHADLTSADLDHDYFRNTDLTGANLAAANLSHAWLLHARAASANLTRANLEQAVLSGANLQRAPLHNADLRNAKLNDLGNQVTFRLRGAADLRNADLTGADLRGANLQGAILTGARYDARTRWPAGFDPEKHGARLTKPPASGRDTILM
jgi:hypothetical protein